MAALANVHVACSGCGDESLLPLRASTVATTKGRDGAIEVTVDVDNSAIVAYWAAHRAPYQLPPHELPRPLVLGVSRSWP